jgi:hypothetical protein
VKQAISKADMAEITGGNHAITHMPGKYLTFILCALSLMFAASLFKNLSYPLFWADESMTVMHGKRVLEYGYPKVHDGKNVLYDLRHPNPTLGVDERTDAFIGGANWGQYYIAAIGVKLAEMSDDVFTKTAIIRTIFALAGLLGLALLAFLASQFFSSRSSKAGFLILFAFLELISVPLVLHLREARYYPLTVFLVALTVFVYTRFRILNQTGYSGVLALLTVSLFLLFITFSPAYFIFLTAIFLFETLALSKRLFHERQRGQGEAMSPPFTPKGLFRDYAKGMLPLIISLIAISPLMVFFRMTHIAEEMSKFNTLSSNTDTLHMYLNNLSIIWRYFASSDFGYLAILLKFGLLFCLVLKLFNKSPFPFDMPKAAFSNFLTILFITYFVAIAKIPNFLFTRYFIPLQPVLALIIILDSAVLYNFFSRWRSVAAVYCKGALIIIFTGAVLFNVATSLDNIEGHVYELSHPYKGPLDYVIPFIKERYAATDNLVIATNYEETSFMYYLNAKVIVGFVGNNLEQDSRIVPDVIVYRKAWPKFREVFSAFLTRGRYGRISFPIDDYPTNNIPELNWSPPYVHRFRTVETEDNWMKADIYLRM